MGQRRAVHDDACGSPHLGGLRARCILNPYHGNRPHWGPRADRPDRYIEWPQGTR